MSAFTDWRDDVHALGGVATTWPFAGNDFGRPAARLSAAAYIAAFNGGLLPTGEGTQASANGQTFYVLAAAMTGSDAVDGSAPHTMGVVERATNAAFTAGDVAAGAAGLPSLKDLQDSITRGLLWVGGAVVAVYVLGQMARGRAGRK
jgi:hypothetical protein